MPDRVETDAPALEAAATAWLENHRQSHPKGSEIPLHAACRAYHAAMLGAQPATSPDYAQVDNFGFLAAVRAGIKAQPEIGTSTILTIVEAYVGALRPPETRQHYMCRCGDTSAKGCRESGCKDYREGDDPDAGKIFAPDGGVVGERQPSPEPAFNGCAKCGGLAACWCTVESSPLSRETVERVARETLKRLRADYGDTSELEDVDANDFAAHLWAALSGSEQENPQPPKGNQE